MRLHINDWAKKSFDPVYFNFFSVAIKFRFFGTSLY